MAFLAQLVQFFLTARLCPAINACSDLPLNDQNKERSGNDQLLLQASSANGLRVGLSSFHRTRS